MSRLVTLAAVALTFLSVAALAAFDSPTPLIYGATAPLALRTDGAPQRLGNGTVRTYVLYDPANRRVPIEVGVAISADAMEGLPAPKDMPGMQHAGHVLDTHERILALPENNPTPYRFVQIGWNPQGHEPPGVYDLAHFDFHFYSVSLAERNAIDPSDPQFAQKAASYPGAEFRAPFYVDGATAAGAPAAAVTVPQMGLHWLDVRSPELQGLTGNPDKFQPFTKTFIYGSWNGQFIFDEPMITRAYLLSKRAAAAAADRDEIIALPTAARRAPAGYYPEAYRITYDAEKNEYRVALTRLISQD
jgi:hypothetical protein